MDLKERIILLPRGKTQTKTTLWIERKKVEEKVGGNVHVAGGSHQGIVVQKEIMLEKSDGTPPPEISLEFRVFLVNAATGSHTQEARTLGFWFRSSGPGAARAAQDFFRDLVTPNDFPRDYVGFITKLMKLLQHGHNAIIRLEVILEQLKPAELPDRPYSPEEETKHMPLTEGKLVDLIESSYPNPVTAQELARDNAWDEQEVSRLIEELRTRGMIKDMDHGAFTRAPQENTLVQVVQQMPALRSSAQPTIAIITALYVEKLAVDAMMTDKETFVRYTTVGESHVYTLGNIGPHRVVCTKLPSVGHSREAVTAAGNATTRLLGTFLRVEHVILVGVGGGVPHFTDAARHVRLGDVVISYSQSERPSYVHCESAKEVTPGKFEFETKKYLPSNFVLQTATSSLHKEEAALQDSVKKNMRSGELEWGGDAHDLARPSPDTDKLYMAINERDLIEVAHPNNNNVDPDRKMGVPRVHLGAVASGRDIARHDLLRQQFAEDFAVSAFDPELHAVLDSVIGNCRNSFIVVRGIADYKDGTRRTEWQNYASLAAAAVTKTILTSIDPTSL